MTTRVNVSNIRGETREDAESTANIRSPVEK